MPGRPRPVGQRPRDGRISQSRDNVTPDNRVRRHIYCSAEVDDYLVMLAHQHNISLSKVVEELVRRFGAKL